MTQPFKHAFLCVIILGSLVVASATFAQTDSEYPNDRRIKILQYSVNDIFTIFTLYGYQTSIEFSQSEEIQTISVGERSLWQIVPSGNRLFIRPMDDEVSTNMTVITNMRTYQFDLKSGKGKLENNPRMLYVARFTYPDMNANTAYVPAVQALPIAPVTYSETPYVNPAKPLMTPPPAAPLTSIQQPADTVPTARGALPESKIEPQAGGQPEPVSSAPSLNHLYTYSGPDSLAPKQMYDDGHATYLKFADMTRLPKVQTIAADGIVTPVTYTLRDGMAVVDSVAARMMLSYPDSEAVYVYNEAVKTEGVSHGK